MKAPKGWEVKKLNFEEGAVSFNSPDLEADQKEGRLILPLKNGCRIQFSSNYGKISFNDIKIKLMYSYSLMGMKSIKFKEITINKYRALQSIFDKKRDGKGIGMSISIPVKNKLFGFSVVWGQRDQAKCREEFNKFLSTVSIK